MELRGELRSQIRLIEATADWSMSYDYDYGYDFDSLYDLGTPLDSDSGQVSGTATFTVSDAGRRVAFDGSTID